MKMQVSPRFINAELGFAADAAGAGLAYVALSDGPRDRAVVLRIPFAVRRYPALLGREVGYAALQAVASALRERGVRKVRFSLPDADLVADFAHRRLLPGALALPYVRLGCALNAFAGHRLAAIPDGDLGARARAETALHAAA